jgi:hypothetical protein
MPGVTLRPTTPSATRSFKLEAIGLATAAAVCLHLVVYSQTLAFYPDEGFDLLAAQLVAAGRRPYLDFFYQHTPLFAYLTAGWITIVGSSWRSAHLLSALLTCGSFVLAGAAVFSLWPPAERGWRTAAVVAVAVFLGFHPLVVKYAAVSQAYGMCLFFSLAAFYAAIRTLKLERSPLAGLAGVGAGAAAAASLLTAPLAPLLLVWLLWYGPTRMRARWTAWFAGGWAVGAAPLLWSLAMAPGPTMFDVFLYHLKYRQAYRAWHWDWEVLQTLAEPQGLILLLLAIVGFLFVIGEGRRDESIRRDMTLCAGLALGLGGFAAATRPTFPQYFVCAVPFVAILASAGLSAIGSRLLTPAQRPWLAAVVAWPFLLTPVRTTHQLIAGAVRPWEVFEQVGRQVNDVTSPDGLVYANQVVYAAARRVPPRGLESEFALDHEESLGGSPGLRSRAELADWLQLGRFQTAVTCANDPDLGVDLSRVYAEQTRAAHANAPTPCQVFWRPLHVR